MEFNEDTDVFMVCGEEIAPTTGTPHIQGYVQLKQKTRLSALKKRWPTAHLEPQRGSNVRASDYCKEDGKYHTHGEMTSCTTQGQRTDLESVKQLIDGRKFENIREEHYATFIRYRRAIMDDIDHTIPHRSSPTELYIYWGPTGVGKSKGASDMYPEAYWKSKGEWWDGYWYQDTVIIDEFYGWLGIDFMLRLCDRYPLSVPVKGSFKKFVAKRVVITANIPWTEWWRSMDERLAAAFRRRITEVRAYKEDGSYECFAE